MNSNPTNLSKNSGLEAGTVDHQLICCDELPIFHAKMTKSNSLDTTYCDM